MAIITSNIFQTYKNEYSSWQNDKNLQAAKRQEYLRRNPEALKDYDLQRAKILLNAVDMMDKSVLNKSDNISVAFESVTNLGLGYAAVGGSALGFLLSKTKFVKKYIDKAVLKVPKSKNFIKMGISAGSGILGVLAVYPIYTFLSKIESKIYRKRRFDTMEKEMQDPKIFAVLDEKQKEIFFKNINEIKKNKDKSHINIAKNEFKNIKQIAKEAWYFDKEQTKFKEKYQENKALYEKDLTEKEIKNAKKDKALLLTLIKEINTKSQSYTEKMERITNNFVAMSFALGSLFALGYERIAKKLKLKTSSIPAGIGISLFIGSTFFANWAQKRAGLVGKFKAKQDLMQNPEQLIYVSNKKTNTISDDEVEVNQNNKNNIFKFLKEFFKSNKEYNEWKKEESITGKDISKAMENIEISQEQLKDGKRLQQNLFRTLYKIDKNTQNYTNKFEMLSETIKYPITLSLGTIGSVLGLKHLARLRQTSIPKEIFEHSLKYLGTVVLFTIPTILVNSYIATAKKFGARISDMMTMKDLEDYRFFADYSAHI